MHRMIVAALIAAAAGPAFAEVRTVISAAGPGSVEISFLNTGPDPVRFEPPQSLGADRAAAAGPHHAIVLTRVDGALPVTIAAGGFISQSYALPPGDGGAHIVTLGNGSALALTIPRVETAAQPLPAGAARPVETTATPVVVATDSGNAFFGNVSSYAPIYAVYGPNTNTDARLQISFKYQLFGTAGQRTSWRDGFNFAYTQRLFWDLGTESSPFRNVDYNPELIYVVPTITKADRTALGGQVGVAHLSNGRDGTASRSLNYVYVQPSATIPIGNWKLTLGPRLTAYVGDLGDNPDIARFRGNTSLFAQIGTDDGWRLSTTSRIDVRTGKGAIDAELTYPLYRRNRGVKLYVFGQGFAGYGENLLDYNRRQTRLRLGVGISR